MKENLKKEAPLADRMRPRVLDEFVGQEHIIGQGRLLRRAIESDRLFSSIIFFGPPGTGKTHLSIALAVQAARRGYRVHFATAQEWVTRLAKAKKQNRLDEELERLGRIPLLIVDEVGYIPFDPEAASLFFALVSSRYERSSLIVSSNKTFSSWPEIFGDPIAVAALVDRLVHHSEVVVLRGESYRLKGKQRELLEGEGRS